MAYVPRLQGVRTPSLHTWPGSHGSQSTAVVPLRYSPGSHGEAAVAMLPGPQKRSAGHGMQLAWPASGW